MEYKTFSVSLPGPETPGDVVGTACEAEKIFRTSVYASYKHNPMRCKLMSHITSILEARHCRASDIHSRNQRRNHSTPRKKT